MDLRQDILNGTKSYTKIEVAKMLCVSRQTISNYIAEGKIKAIKLSERKIIITETALKEYLDKYTILK